MYRTLLLILFSLLLALTSTVSAQVPANEDVGNPAVAGSLAYDPNADAWSVTGAGNDIWGNADQFHFVFRPLVGDGEGIAYVTSSDCAHEWSKVGVMIRESLDAGSKHVMVGMTGAHGVQTVWRPETGGGSQGATTEGVALPMWFKITRTGDTISTAMTWDQNKTFWIPDQTLTVPMNETVYIGMFVCSHQGDTACTAVFEGVDLQAPPYLSSWNLSPADGALISDPTAGVTLSWMPGDTAASHNVHFGTTSPPELVTNQTETSYDTGALEGGTTYYYRIDEVEEDGTTIHEGEERSFKTQRAGTGTILYEVWEGIGGTVVSDLTNNANYPANPSSSEERTSLEAPVAGDEHNNFGGRLHGWLLPETSGDYTFWIASDDSSNLYLSSDENPANAVRIAYVDGWTGSRAWDNYDTQMSDPVALEAGQMYYISAVYKEGGGGDNCAVAWEGPDSPTRSVIDGYYLMPFENLWAWEPSPADGATGVAMSPTLSWLPAVDAVSYDVYVDGALLGNTAETSMPAGPFALSEDLHPSTHTWRVDTVTDSEVRTGSVWSFTVVNNRLIDDFEAYDIIPVAPPGQEIIGGNYTIEAIDPGDAGVVAYWAFDGDFSDVSGNGNDGDPCGATIVDDPERGQVASFDGDGDYVDCGNAAALNFGTGNWSLSAWVKNTMTGTGDENKGAIVANGGDTGGGHRYCLIVSEQEEGEVTLVVDDDVNKRQARGDATKVNDNVWHHVLGVREGDTTKIYIDGVLEGGAELPAGYDLSGAVQHNVLIGAITNHTDGSIYKDYGGLIDDVRIYDSALTEGNARYLAGIGDKHIPAVYGPMRLHLEFEGDATDSSGNGNDGTLVGDIAFEDDPVMGQVVSLPGGDNQFVEVGEVGLSGNDPTTIACWAKADHTDIPDWTLIFGFTTSGGGNGSHFNIGSLGGPGGVGAHCWGWEETIFSDQEALDWHHYAMTYDGTTITYYGDGVYMDTDTGKSNVQDLSIRADNVHVGSRITQASSFPGKVDDARIYDYAMSDAEIAGLAGYVPTDPITDTWSDFGFVDMMVEGGAMRVDTSGLPGLPYYIGDVSRTLPFADLNAGGGKALSVWFQGDPANATEFMYMMLADSDGQSDMVLYDGDAANLASEEWQEWNIDMRDFEGVDPANADEITIGLAGLDGSADGDVMNFDNIRVYSGRCMPELRKPSADINNDCIVNVGDIEEMIADWGETTLTYTITANGGDIWGSADAFHYMYQEMSGDAEAVVQVTELLGPGTNGWTKAGIMIRETLEPGSRNAFVAITGGEGNGATFQWRPEPDAGSSSSRTLAGISPPASVRLVREGDTFTGYVLMDGEWQQEGDSATVVMTDPVYIGLALTSHQSDAMRTAKFDDLVINGVAEPELTGLDIGDTLPGSSDSALILSPGDFNEDAVVDWADVFVLLDSWLEEKLWPY